MATLPEDRRLKVEARTAELLAEVEGLRALRKLAGKTQRSVADKLKVKQPSVVQAAGGTLELRVTLPDTGPLVLTGLGDLRPEAARPRRERAAA
jgi:hypothetical protein